MFTAYSQGDGLIFRIIVNAYAISGTELPAITNFNSIKENSAFLKIVKEAYHKQASNNLKRTQQTSINQRLCLLRVL